MADGSAVMLGGALLPWRQPGWMMEFAQPEVERHSAGVMPDLWTRVKRILGGARSRTAARPPRRSRSATRSGPAEAARPAGRRLRPRAAAARGAHPRERG